MIERNTALLATGMLTILLFPYTKIRTKFSAVFDMKPNGGKYVENELD